jgi:hypothetical protein
MMPGGSRAGRERVAALPDDEARGLINDDAETTKLRLNNLRLAPRREPPPDPPIGPNPFGVALERRRERDAALAERDALKRERDALKRERDEALDACDSAVARADRLARERDEALVDRDTAVADRDAAMARMARERDAAVAAEPPERDRHKRGGDSATGEGPKRPRSRGPDESG